MDMIKCNIFANLKQNNCTNQHLWKKCLEMLPMASEIIDSINVKEHCNHYILTFFFVIAAWIIIYLHSSLTVEGKEGCLP